MDDTTKTVLALAVRHLLTSVAGSLVTLGLVQASDKNEFITILTGIFVGAIGIVWSWWQKRGRAALEGSVDYWKDRARRAEAPPVQTVIQGGKP